MIYTIDDLIGQHWAGCDVLRGETPEQYASRHERERLYASIIWWHNFLLFARSPDE